VLVWSVDIVVIGRFNTCQLEVCKNVSCTAEYPKSLYRTIGIQIKRMGSIMTLRLKNLPLMFIPREIKAPLYLIYPLCGKLYIGKRARIAFAEL
jgi:hypothetical protein